MYHQKTLELLKIDKRFPVDLCENLIASSPNPYPAIPQAVWEWICLQNQPAWQWGASEERKENILRFYSNDDHFWINEHLIWEANEEGSFVYEGLKIVDFATENQNNFLLGIVADGHPDPQVMYTDYQEKRWVPYVHSFSDFIYAQIFDWQFKLTGKRPYWRKEIDHYGYFKLKYDPMVYENLNQRYTIEPSSQLFWEEEDIQICRYSIKKTQRLVVYSSNRKDYMGIEVYCHHKKDIEPLQNKLLADFSAWQV
ncbi:MAG TPA: hypothetical protein DCM08_14010 [Microscillaceae bacterium]|jgi:hypothetical protein|nr:hypothetical protein [Microscillaceae bacterium]